MGKVLVLVLVLVLAVIGLTALSARSSCSLAQEAAKAPSQSIPAQTPKPAVVSVDRLSGEEYIVNPEDVLDVSVFDVPEFSRQYTVSPSGALTLPLLTKPIQAAGMSSNELAQSIEDSYRQGGILSRPQITVQVVRSPRSVVTVEGAVRTPSAVPVLGRTSLLYILSQAGGLTDDAGDSARVFRGMMSLRALALEGGSIDSTVSVDMAKLVDGGDPSVNVPIFPGDRVVVERAGVFYVLGEVARPGGYNLRNAQEQVSVLQALAIAGDVTSVARKDKAVLIRKDAKAPQGRLEIALNLQSILMGHGQDQVLKPNDIIYIPSSRGKRALRTAGLIGQSAAPMTASGLILYRR